MPGRDPHTDLEEAVAELNGGTIPGKVPRRWERFSDVVILPRGSFEGPGWQPDQRLWEAVGRSLGAGRVARMGEVTGEFRESGVEMLLGEDDWVVRRESGVDYGYPMTRCMFSAGNVNERRRMGELASEREVVVDMYAGIGYYTLPVLVHGGATVHACEWNPEAARALRWGLEANGVADRCTVHEGDNMATTGPLAGVADRVIMGLLPSSEEGLGVALGVLSGGGGTIHVHGLARPGEHEDWAEGVVSSASSMRPGEMESDGVTRVKSYAPRWDHVVLDLRVA